MGKRTYKLMQTLRNEQAQIAKAAKKRGLWSSLGSALLGGVAMLVTGGAASPVVAGLFAGGARALGGHLGNYLAGQSEGGKLKGGRFFQGQRASLAQSIKDKINTGAVKSAFQVGGMNLLGKLGGKLKIGSKGKISGELDLGKTATETAVETGKAATTDGGFLGKLFESGDKAPGKYGTAQKGFKGLIDYEGSPLGKFFEEGRKSKILTAQRSRVATDIPEFTQQMPISETDIAGEFGAFGKPGQEFYKSQIDQLESMDPMALRGQMGYQAPAFEGQVPISEAGDVTSFIDVQGAEDVTGFTNIQGSPLGDYAPESIQPGPQIPGALQGPSAGIEGTGLSAEEWIRKQEVEKVWDWEEAGRPTDPIGSMQRFKRPTEDTLSLDPTRAAGPKDTYLSSEGYYSSSIPVSEKASALSPIEQKYYEKVNQMEGGGYNVGVEGGLPEEYGRGYISKETGDIVRPPARPDVSLPAYKEDLEFVTPTTMDEVSVTARGPQLTGFDEASWAQGRDRIRDATKQAWWGGGPPVEEGLSSEPVGMGELDPDIRTSFPQPNLVKPLGQGTGSRLQRAADLQKSSAWHKRLFGDY